MDHYSRGIFRAFIIVIILACTALAISLIVPYDVPFDAQITNLEGSAAISVPNRTLRSISPNDHEPIRLRLDETLQLDPGSTVTITFDINGGRAVIEGPVALRLVKSERTATTLGHLSASGDYTLTIEQDGGTARYYFDDTNPPIEDMNIAIWVNNASSDIVPITDPCWLAEIPTEGPATSTPITCP